jgi:Tfp pilus assembly ATPase PilU
MQTMDAALAQLVRQDKITRKLAEQRAAVPEELKRLLGPTPMNNGPTYVGAAGSLSN